MRVFATSLSGPGHAHPMMAVVRALAARGHDVLFVSGAEHERDTLGMGASFMRSPDSKGSPRDALTPYDDAEDYARMLVEQVAAWKPEIALVDLLTYGGALVAEMLGIAYATLSIHPLHVLSDELPPFGFGKAPARGVLRVRDACLRRWVLRDLERARSALNASRARLGLRAESRLVDAQLSADLILVATIPSLEIARADWPPQAVVVGPCLWPAGDDWVPAWPQGDEPLVLVAATTAHEQQPFVRAAIRAVEELGVRAIVTMGGTETAVESSRRVVVAPFASHDAVLRRARAVVCSGGHGIVARSLVHGVPLVVVPGHGDQRENGYRVARAGAGRLVLRPDPRRIRRALGEVLHDERYAIGAGRLAAEAAALDGPARAVDLLEDLAARKARA